MPFTHAQFFAVFAAYNVAIWPIQIIAYGFGLMAAVALLRPGRASGLLVAIALSIMWLWTGFAYHIIFFSEINAPAYAFGAFFVIQGLLLMSAGVRHRLDFAGPTRPVAWVGLSLAGYAAIVYPLINRALGHAYPAAPVFGVTPCPVTIFTIGFLLIANRAPVTLFVIPLIWSAIGGSAAVLLSVPADWGLLVAGTTGLVFLLTRNRWSGQARRVTPER